MVTGGAVCSNWACTESVRGEVSDGLPYLDQPERIPAARSPTARPAAIPFMSFRPAGKLKYFLIICFSSLITAYS